VGRVSSYMSKDDASAIPGVWMTEKVFVGQGKGLTTIQLTLEEVEATESERSWSDTTGYGVEAEFSKIISAGGSFEQVDTTTESSVWSVEFGTATSYTGMVGHIERISDWRDHKYSYGMAVYPIMIEGYTSQVQVINFYVENYQGEETPPDFGENLGNTLVELTSPEGVVFGVPSPAIWVVAAVLLVVASFIFMRRRKKDD